MEQNNPLSCPLVAESGPGGGGVGEEEEVVEEEEKVEEEIKEEGRLLWVPLMFVLPPPASLSVPAWHLIRHV